jgi:hypothetical protein
MARRWRTDPESDLPTPYGPSGVLQRQNASGAPIQDPTDELSGTSS